MTGLDYSFEVKNREPLNAEDGRSMFLTSNERSWVEAILLAVRSNGDDYPLLRDAIQRFTKPRMAADKYVIDAIKELDQLAEERVLLVPSSHIKEYEQVLKRFHALPMILIPERRYVCQAIINNVPNSITDTYVQPINESQFLAPKSSQVCQAVESPKEMILTQRSEVFEPAAWERKGESGRTVFLLGSDSIDLRSF